MYLEVYTVFGFVTMIVWETFLQHLKKPIRVKLGFRAENKELKKNQSRREMKGNCLQGR